MEQVKVRKTDRRTVYTRNVIREAFLNLMKQFPVEKITVTEICRLAEINRCTFYIHYADAMQVFEEFENEVYEKLIVFVNESLTDEDNRQNLSNIMYASFREDPIYTAVMESGRVVGLFRRLTEYVKSEVVAISEETGLLTRREAELFTTFIINGCAAVYMEWYNTRNFEGIEEENRFLNRLMEHGMSVLDIHGMNKAFRERLDRTSTNRVVLSAYS